MKVQYGKMEREINLPNKKIKQIYKFLDEWRDFKSRRNIIEMGVKRFSVSYDDVVLIEYQRKQDLNRRKNGNKQ